VITAVAADSAGGVVYGDLVGDIIYKDIDWELYPHDSPVDGEIGNCTPGSAPLPARPPYHDPTKGPIDVIVTPPPHHPALTYFCLGPSDKGGRVVERGAAYYILVAKAPDGHQHLYLVENGHRYDLGVWEPAGGCATITHPPGGGGGGGPTVKPCLPDETCTPHGGCEIGVDCDPGNVPPELTWNVEFIGYSDGNTPTATVTVPGLTPGPGVMLVVLVNAICNNLTAGSLLPPTISGATGMTFDAVGSAIAGGDGVESFGAVTRTPRTDPGTFDINVTWAGGHQSREHIVTVWKLTFERPDLLDRMKAGQYIHAFSWDRVGGVAPSPYNPPGKGPARLELADPSSDAPPYPSRVDVVVAQSLADSPTGPFGASFDDTAGTWWTPAFADAVPALTAGETVCDNFDARPDGPLEPPDYASFPDPLPYRVWVPFTVASGHVEWTGHRTDTDPRPAACARVARSIEGSQAIEVTVSRLLSMFDFVEIELYTNQSDTTLTGVGLYVMIRPLAELVLTYGFNNDPLVDDTPYWGDVNISAPITYDTATIRLETDVDGTCRAFYNGTLLFTGTPTFTPAPYVGVVMTKQGGEGTGGAAPLLEEICSGPAGGIIRKCSWVAGYRPTLPLVAPIESTVSWVDFAEVNFGPDDLQSSQCAVVVSPLSPDTFGWHVLANYANGPTPPALVPPMSHSSSVRYERNSMIVVFVSAFAATNITAGITVSSTGGLTFTRSVNEPKSDPFSHGQGAVFTAKTPTVLAPSDTITVGWAASLEGVSYLIMEVTNADAVAAHASATRGTHAAGSVTGGVSALLSATSVAGSVVFGVLGVLSQPTEIGGTVGAGWVEEIEYFPAAPADHTWYLAESIHGSAVTAVDFDEMMDSGALASDAVVLGIEITPGPDFVDWEVLDDTPTSVGGTQDAFDGPIFEAGQRAADGSTIWELIPGDHV